jgi:penicillin-binding protein-related factor A (putative recombinase)
MGDQRSLFGGKNAPGHPSRRSKIGNVTEAIVEVHNVICERAGLAALRRVSTPMKVVGRAPKGVDAVFAKATTVDYLGWTMTTTPARPVAVEVKHVELTPAGVRFPFDNLEPQQRIDLSSIHKLGGIAVLLVVCNAKLYPVPWSVVQPLLDARRPSMLVDAFLATDKAYLRAILAGVLSPSP